jgi:hypothetical protein
MVDTITVMGDGFTAHVVLPLPDGLTTEDLTKARGLLTPGAWSSDLAETLYSIKSIRYEVRDNPLLWERQRDYVDDPAQCPIVGHTLTITLAASSR